MRILHLVSSNKWTGAAAPAFVEAEALRGAGVDAMYGFVGGGNLEPRLANLDWALPLMQKNQNPATFFVDTRALRAFLRERRIDIVHTHLSHDHGLALWASRETAVRVVRTFRAKRTLRTDPLSRQLLRRTDGICVANGSFLSHRVLAGREALFTPPPVDHRIFHPGTETARSLYGLSNETPVMGFIGKVSPDRGFEDAVRVLHAVRPEIPEARLLIIGAGPHREAVESLARDLGVTDATIWAGYQDEGLVSHFRAADLTLFTAPGSDEGHRAISEAMACGTPVASYPLAGVRALMGELAGDLVSDDATVGSLAGRVVSLIKGGSLRELSTRCHEKTREFDFTQSAARLVALYEKIA